MFAHSTILQWNRTKVFYLEGYLIVDGLTNIIYKVSKRSNCDDYPLLFRIYGAGKNGKFSLVIREQ